jgi:type IV pilus assembly protein PilA
MKNLQKGFTLIELMIVVAIIAILAAIAIPAYQNYLIRSQVSEGAVLSDGAKTAVSEYYSNHGSWPSNGQSAGLPTNAASISGKYVSAVAVANGVITATFSGPEVNSKISGDTFTLSPIDNGGSVNWTCNGSKKGTIPDTYLPSSCR